MTQKKQFAKKKQREKDAKAKVLIRREAIRKAARAEKSRQKLEDEFRPKTIPIIKNTTIEKKYAEREVILKNAIEKNLAVLKKLEAEYIQEQETRKALNEKYLSEGKTTLAEKLKLAEEQAEAERLKLVDETADLIDEYEALKSDE